MDKFIVTSRKTKTRRDIHDLEEVQPSCSSNKLEPEVAEGSTCKNSSNSSTTPDEQLDNECSTRRSSRISDSSLESELSEDASVEPEGVTLKKKRKVYSQKFRNAWTTKFTFIEEKYGHSYCKICNIKLVCGIYNIKRHETSKQHINKLKAARSTPQIKTKLSKDPEEQMNTSIKKAELKLTAFLAEHNLPFMLMDHLPLLCKSAFPDSQIAKKVQLKRKKSTQLTMGILGPARKSEVVEFIQNNSFSIIIDESTDISLKKCLVVVARYFTNRKVIDSFLDLIEVESADAQGLYNCIKKLLDDNKIPYTNLVGLAADNANVMLGQIKSVQALLKNNINSKIVVIGCTCHSFHLCSSYACKKLPESLEQFVHDVCNYFSKSSKRNEDLKEFQNFVEETPSKILKISKTRWLSLGMVVTRLLKHWNSLTLYFQNEVLQEQVLGAQQILSGFNANITKCYLLFLSYILGVVNKVNLEFQSEMPKITVLLERVTTSYKVILKCFIKKTVLDRYKNNIGALVVNDPSNFLELDKMYFGAELELYLSGNNTIIDKAELHSFKRRALDFYIELCIQIKSRFNFSSDVLHFASFFEPNLVISGDILSIAQAGLFFSGLDIDMEELNVEWNLASEVGKNFSDLDLQGFWASINEQKNSLGEPMFSNLMVVASKVLSLPHSSAAAERVFSQLNLIKLKTRNRLNIKTVCSLLHTKEMLKDKSCYTFEPDNRLLSFNKNIANIEILQDDVLLNN